MSRCRNRGRGAEVYQVGEVGECRAEACPGDNVGVQPACLKLILAEACPGIDAGGVKGRGVSK